MEENDAVGDGATSSLAHISQAFALFAEATSETAAAVPCFQNAKESDGESEEEENGSGPGKGNAVLGSKAYYVRREAKSQLDYVKSLEDQDPDAFVRHAHIDEGEFEDMFTPVRPELEKPMDVRSERTHAQNDARKPRARKLDNKEMFFFFHECLGGSVEGSKGVEQLGELYGMTKGTVSNFFRHVLFAVVNSMKSVDPPLIRWPDANERAEIHGLIPDFPKCVFFVDGNKGRFFRPQEEKLQFQRYGGYKKTHCFSTMVVTDVFGKYNHVVTSTAGWETDKTMYLESEVGMQPSLYLSEGECGMADMGYAGIARLEVLDKKNSNLLFPLRRQRNKTIRGNRVVNEWAMGYVNNRHRIFLGRWPYSPEIYAMSFDAACLMANWRFDRRRYALKRRNFY